VRRVNVSIDTLDPATFRTVTRWGDLPKVLSGIDAARWAGLKVKINPVALKGVNEDDIERLMLWVHGRNLDLTLIEVTPLGEIEPDRIDLLVVRARLLDRYTHVELDERTGGPASYVRVKETGGKLGFITPLTHNFCEHCNRVRLTCTGKLYMCLGQEDSGPAHPLAPVGQQQAGGPGDQRGYFAQTQGPRLRHRPTPQPAGRQTSHERYGRVKNLLAEGMLASA
jgi:GTP 3',8-cyclase